MDAECQCQNRVWLFADSCTVFGVFAGTFLCGTCLETVVSDRDLISKSRMRPDVERRFVHMGRKPRRTVGLEMNGSGAPGYARPG
jgi:hypothetical protein